MIEGNLYAISHLLFNFPKNKSFVVPVSEIENHERAIGSGVKEFFTKPVDFKDLEITIVKTLSHVLQLRQTLQALKENNILRLYVGEPVLNFMGGIKFEQALLQNETVVGSVAFIDIGGLSAISETQPADQVVSMWNDYFDIMVKNKSHKRSMKF